MKEKKQYPTVQSAPLSRERGAGGECEKNAPRLRFPGFEGEWEERKGSQLFNNSRRKGAEGLPIYSVTIDDGLVLRESLDRNYGNDAKPEDNLKIKPMDLAYNMMRMWQAAVGVSYWDGMVSPAYVVLEPQKGTDSIFFYHFFKTKRKLYFLKSFSYGLTDDRLRLYFKDFSAIKFSVPSLPEQQKIASFLTAIDTRIGQLSRKKALLEQYKKGVMQQLFSRKIRFRDEEGKAFPEWEVKRLGEVFDEINEKNDGRKNHPVMTISARQGLISQKEKFDRVIAGDSLKKYTLIRKGDFAYNKGNSKLYEMGCIYQLEENESALVPFVYICFSPTEKVYRSFYKHWFLNHGLDRQLKRIITSGVRGDGLLNVSSRDFFRLKVPVPCVEEQKKIGEFLDVISSKINKVEDQLTQTQTFKKGLLQQLFV